MFEARYLSPVYGRGQRQSESNNLINAYRTFVWYKHAGSSGHRNRLIWRFVSEEKRNANEKKKNANKILCAFRIDYWIKNCLRRATGDGAVFGMSPIAFNVQMWD